MMPYRMLLACLMLCAPVAAHAQPATQARPPERPDGAQFWTPSEDRMTFTSAGISFPRRAGTVSLVRTIAFGRRNVGLDNGIIYRSADDEILASAYIYLPGLSHEGLAAFVSEHFMRFQSGDDFRAIGTRTTAAGGQADAAIRSDYANFYDDNAASSSAFVRAGRWVVKLRVSGPESRRADVESTIAALLEAIQFGDRNTPRLAVPLEVAANCPAAPAAAQPRLQPRTSADALEDAIFAVSDALDSDGAGNAPRRDAYSSFPRSLCISSRREIASVPLPILRAMPSPAGEDSIRTVAIAILNDSGSALEVVERRRDNRSRFVIRRHGNAETRVLGSYDAMPSDALLQGLIDGQDEAGAVPRATITYDPESNSRIALHVAPE